MNANCFKTVFSEHLGCLVAVGEHASSQGKSSGESAFGEGFAGAMAAAGKASAGVFIGALVLSLAWVSLAWAQPAANALPVAGQVVQGAASLAQSANQLNITQASQRAAIHWQSFDIGASAKVNVVQPNAQAVLLNRVVGQSPSQIFGQLQANGHVILVNPNGVLFGKDGSVNAGSFTASTLGISDADFMAGNMLYRRNGSTAGVVNQGTIEVSPGGYVALLGASVSNEGKIIAPQGGVVSKGGVALGSGETIKVPVNGSGRIKLELTAADINASVRNTGQIVAEGGQVYMQALALNQAAAQVIQSGSIDTTGEQGGAVHLLADGGTIKVDGSITANSTGTDDKGQPRKGGDIVIGRDLETGVLAAATDVSGAKLESNQGFVETSGDWLAAYGTRVVAKDWLLDPTNITIAASGASGTAYASSFTAGADSVILASDISASLTAGTSVTIATSAAGASAGHIAVDESIAKTGGADASLTLQAHGNIVVAANKTIMSSVGKLDVLFNANSADTGGGILFNTGSGITSNGGNITLGGGSALTGAGFAVANGVSSLQGISLNAASIHAGGGNIVMNGQTAVTNYQGSLSNVAGIYMAGSSVSTSGAGTISLTGKNQNTDTQSKGFDLVSGTITGGSTGAVTIVGDSRDVASSTYTFIRGVLLNGTVASAGGNVSVTGYGGAGAQYDYGVDMAGSVTAIGSGTISISGTAGTGGSGGNVGVYTSGAGTISSVDGAIAITGTGATGGGVLRDHGVLIGGSNAVRSTGTGSITVTGTAVNNDNGYTRGVSIEAGGLRTNSGNIKVDAAALLNYQVAAYVNAPITSTSGNVYLRSASSNIQNTATGTISGNNVSIDNTGGTIDANGVITKGAGGASTWSGVISQKGVDIKGTITAASNLNIYGNQTGSDTGISIGANLSAAGNLNLYGVSSGGKGIDFVTGQGISGGNIQATGKTTSGVQGVLFNGSNTVTTTGTSGDSLIKGITTAGGSNALLAWSGLNLTAATGTTLTLWGDGTNTGDRAARFDGGGTTTGDVTLKGTSNNATALMLINGAVTANANSALTLSGTTNGAGQQGVYFVNSGGVRLGNGATLNITGQNTNATGASTGVLLGGVGVTKAASATSAGAVTITGSTSSASGSTGVSVVSGVATDGNITIQGTVVSASNTGVNIASTITSYGVGDAINVSSNYSIVHGGAIANTSGGATASINLTSTSGSVSGSGTLASDGVTASGGGMTLNTATAGTMSGVISGTGSLTKMGAGTTLLTAANSYSGTTTVSAGVLQIGDGGTTGTLGTGAVTDNASLVFNRSDLVTVANAISGTGALTQSGTGTTILTGANSYAGATTISAGTLQVGNGGTVGSLGTGAVVDSSALVFNRTDNITVANAISGTGTVTQAGTGVLTFPQAGTGTMNNTYTGQTYVNAGTLSLKATSNLAQYGTGQFNIASGATLNFDVASGINTLAYTNSIFAGNGTISKTGAGQVVWNTTAAAFNLGAGALIDVQAGTFVGSSNSNENWTNNLASLNVASGAIFAGSEGNIRVDALTGAGSVSTGWSTSGGITVGVNGTAAGAYNTTAGSAIFSGVISSTTNNTAVTSLSKLGAGTQILTGANIYKGVTSIGAGTLQIGNGSTTGTLGTGAVIDNASLVFNRSNSLTVANAIGGTGALVQMGAGTTILTADNTYTGTTTINTGTLQIGNATTTGTLGTGAVTNNGHLTFNRSDAMTVSNVIGGSGTVNQAGTGTTTLAADNSYSGATTVSAGTLQVGSGGASGTLGNSTGVTLSNNANLTFSKNVNTVIDKAIGGQGHLTANITGDLSLNSNVALTGTNTINLLASGAITQSSGSLAATNLYMSATSGGIGDAANRIQTQVSQLSLSSGGNVFVTEANAVSVAAQTTANNGSLDIVTTQGSLSVGAVNGLTGITAHGSGNVSLSGTTNTGTGVFVGRNITASNGDVTIYGSTASTVNPDAGVKSAALVSGKNITLVASATAASGSVLGYYGAGGGFSASGQLNLSGTSSNGGNGFYSYTGSIVAVTGITIAGSSVGGQGLGLDNQVTLTNTTGAIHLTGTSNDATKQAIGLRGSSITNGGGDIVLNAVNGVMFTGSGNINWGNGVLTNSITSNGSGVVRVNAGNNNLASSSSIDGSVLTITQNSNAGVIVSTSGTGNLTSPKVINNGSGDVTLAAGSQIAAGTATGGQVSTVVGNSVTQASTGKTYVYSGAAASTGLLSRISASLTSLYYEGGSHTRNAAFNQAYGASIAGGENTQVLFRESTAPSFDLNLGAIALSKTYGQADPDVLAAVQAAYAGTTLTKVVAGPGGSNTFAVAADDVLPTITGTRLGGHNASVTPYAYAMTAGLNTVVTYQPSLLIHKAPLTVVLQGLVQKEYDGTTAASGLSSAHYNVSGWATVSGSTEGASVNQPLAAYASAEVANNNGSGVVTATLQASNFVANAGTDMANYSLPPSASGNVGLITRAPLSVKVNDTAMFVTQDPNAAFDQGFSAGSNQLKNGETLLGVLGPLSRSYIGAPNPGAGVYSGVYGFSTVPAADNYTVYPVPGGLTVARADQLLLTVGSASASYGMLSATHAGASASHVSAQYCLVSTNCNGANIAHLAMNNQGAGRWTATDSSNSTISFETVVDTTGKISGAGFVKTGNYTFFTNNLSTAGTVNFNGTVVSAGVLTVDPVPVSLNVSSVAKVYDGTTSVASLALMPTGVLPNDMVSVASSGGYFGGVNAGPQSFSLTGLNLQGSDRANYYISSNGVTGTGSITPKTLSLSAWALNKVYDGSRAATVNWGALSGLVGSEQLGISAQGTFASADVGNDKAVFATFSLADGANGGLASNYVLAPQTLMASILKNEPVDPVRPSLEPAKQPVQPVYWPQASRHKSTAVVYEPSPVASASQPALGRSESVPCSDEPTDSCMCEDSPVAGIQICYVPKGALDNEPTQTAKSERVNRPGF